ncbi:MAG TPA: type IX secretion system protein PorQ [Salinivirga sp.]|uniref:type IX secretion system protein PorQ n=1 Tax=Salinivirga sp. TaxID=1970192 RepID=UPI002B47CAA5|nr:type IX secretion system protein PorQ [Salinivirga sp.]HKK58276.1 type IX secretion system protein PorQ [Salinivirga sp.]
MNRFFGILFFILSVLSGFGQSDLSSVYRFLTVPTSAYSASLGGAPIVSADSSINFIADNPALLKPKLDQQVGLNFTNLHPGVNMGMIAWGYDLKELGFVGAGLQYMNYGEMDRIDQFGNDMGTFNGGDYALIIGWSQPLMKNLRLGASVKGIYSKIDRYDALAAAFDAALTYHNPDLQLTVSLMAKNIGTQIEPYVEGEDEPLPQDYQFGVAKGLEHAPFRFSVVAHHLHDFDLLLTNNNTVTPNNTNLPPEEIETDYIRKDAEKIMRHLIFALEFIPSKRISARVGYNYYRRSTMKMIDKGGMVGFSLGASVLIKGFHIEYARASYHLAGATNHISVRTNLGRFFE